MRKIVYTAIIGGYDGLPTFINIPEGVEFIAFVDEHPNGTDTKPWRIVEIGNFFIDRKISSGYLKTNAHLLFGRNCICLWVDGNLRDIDVSDVLNLHGPIAVPPHLDRSTVGEEIDTVVEHGLEFRSSAVRHRAFLDDQGFPDDIGLSATMLVARDLRDPRVRRAGAIWWDCISRGVRRDQLSFDFACWAAGILPSRLDVDWRMPNALFRRIDHRHTHGRGLAEIKEGQYPGAALDLPWLPADYPKNVIYAPESPTDQEGELIRALNEIVSIHAPSGKVEGNYCHFNDTKLDKYSPSDPRRSWKREFLRHSICGRRRALEVGFNAGHSAAMMLTSQPDLVLHSVDIAIHKYTIPCADFLRLNNNGRFSFTIGDSKIVLPVLRLEEYDFIHIDGGHDVEAVQSDLSSLRNHAATGTLIVVDDAYVPHIAQPLGEAITGGWLEEVTPGFACSGENRLFRKC